MFAIVQLVIGFILRAKTPLICIFKTWTNGFYCFIFLRCVEMHKMLRKVFKLTLYFNMSLYLLVWEIAAGIYGLNYSKSYKLFYNRYNINLQHMFAAFICLILLDLRRECKVHYTVYVFICLSFMLICTVQTLIFYITQRFLTESFPFFGKL